MLIRMPVQGAVRHLNFLGVLGWIKPKQRMPVNLLNLIYFGSLSLVCTLDPGKT